MMNTADDRMREMLLSSRHLLALGHAVIHRSRDLCIESHALHAELIARLRTVGTPRRPRPLVIRGGADGPVQPTARDRVLAFLRDHPGKLWCAECMAVKVGLPRARTANVFLAAEGINGFRRRDAVCASCARRRLGLVCVTSAAPNHDLPDPDDTEDAELRD